MGDFCHATVPFYGQGMNAGFEDCTVMWELYNQHQNWDETFKAYQKIRKADGDALQDLSLHNYYVMRDHVANDDFLLQKKIEAKLHENILKSGYHYIVKSHLAIYLIQKL